MKYNILYVDDEPENLRAFKAVFRREYNIFITDSPSQGLDYLHKNNVDLIITDQRMPEMSGVDFLKEVYEFMPKKPPCRMIYSGYAKTQAIDEAKNNNWFSVFVAKPCDPEILKTKIDTAISDCSH
ncbi:MAG: response regulator [Bacteroidetes bacterium]|nr:MAG: response regulator [Bacteroidota bacterium]